MGVGRRRRWSRRPLARRPNEGEVAVVAAAGRVARQAASFARQPKPRSPRQPQATGRRRLLHCSESVKRHHPASAIVVPKIAAPGIESPVESAVCKWVFEWEPQESVEGWPRAVCYGEWAAGEIGAARFDCLAVQEVRRPQRQGDQPTPIEARRSHHRGWSGYDADPVGSNV